MADNVAQSIKDLDERIKSLDKGLQNTMNLSKAIAENSDMLGNVMMQALKKGSDESKEAVKNLKELNKTITDTFGNGKEIKIAIGIEKDRLKKEIAETENRLKKFNDNTGEIKSNEKDLSGYKEQLAQLGNFEKTYARINQIVNAGKGNAGTLLGKARADEMTKVQKYTKLANEELARQQRIEDTIAKIRERKGKSAKFDGEVKSIQQLNDMLTISKRQLDEYIRTLNSLGSRGRSAASGFGGDGTKTALRNQETNFIKLNKLLNQRREILSRMGKGGTDAQKAEYKALNAEIRNTIGNMRELESKYNGITNKARQGTLYQRLHATNQSISRLNDSLIKTKTSLESMLPNLRRLASAFGVAFSVQGLVNFGRKLVETRGEFEMQFVAMKQIIGDVDAATKIWNQTMQQALQSPFRAMQLVDYTKKLAAYRIETDKLFDTTKRLADVSAGLGVDMGRLILAYGQVKSANFLRASEVRQFTEAGVNIYDNLANYFSEIEGRAVTVSEVIDRVTKRMVLFSDVEEIFKRMTDEGGVFFNMQEVQADTVRGQIMKLHDAYDQMLNTIGQANQGTLRNLLETANRLVRNWRDVAAFLKAQIPLFAVMIPYWVSMRKIQSMTAEESALLASRLATLKTSFLSTTKSTKSATLALHEQRAAMMRQRKEMALNIERIKRLINNKELLTRATRMWTRSMKTSMIQSAAFDTVLKSLIVSGEMLKSTLRSIAPFLAIEGIIFLVNSLTSASRKAAEFKKELRELTDEQMGRGDEEANEYKRLVKELEATNEGSIERAKVIQKINDKYGVYLDNLYNESSSLEDVANGYEVVAERAKEAARARALEEGYSKILGKYNQERSDSIFDLAKHPHGYSGGFGKAGTFLSTGGTFDISKDDAKGFSEYVDEIVERNEELYASMSQVERQKAIRQLYKDYFGKELPAGAAQLFNFIDNTVDRLAALKDYEQSLEKDFNLKGINKELRDRIIGIRDDAKELISQIEGAKRGDSIILPIGMKLDIKKTRDDADTDVNSILTYIKRRVEEQSKQKEIDLRLSSGIIGEEEAKKLRDRIGRLTDETANQINDKIIKQIKEAYNVTGDLLDYIEKNPWDKNMGEMFAAINSGLITQNDIVQGIGKAEEVIQGRLQGQLSVLQDINKKKNSGLITDKAQLDALLKQERSVQTTYQWLQKTLFLLKNRAEVSEVQSALLDNTTIDKAKERVRKKFGENVANDIKIGYAFDYANINMVQSAVADAYHKAGDEIDKEIKSIRASANADKEKIKMLERQRDIQYELANAYGYVDQKARSGGQKESVSRLISLIKEMRSEYDKLSESAYGYAKSEEKVRASFGDSWEAILKEASVPKDFDFSTNAGEIAALERVRDYVKGNAKFAKDAWKDVQKVIDQLKTESEIEVQVRIREDFGRQMEEAFGNYELTLDLQKLNLPSDVAEDMFGIEPVTLDQIRQKIGDWYDSMRKDGYSLISQDDYKEVEKYLKKVDDLERKQQRERIKDYAKYLEYEMSERAKIAMDYTRKIAEVQAETSFKPEQRERIINGLKKEMGEKLAQQDWEDFKGTEVYVQMMEDLEKHGTDALVTMRNELEKVRDNAENLSPRALKEVVNAIEKIKEIELNRSTPFVNVAEARKEFNEAMRDAGVSSAKELFQQADALEKRRVELSRQKMELEGVVGAQREYYDATKKLDNINKQPWAQGYLNAEDTDEAILDDYETAIANRKANDEELKNLAIQRASADEAGTKVIDEQVQSIQTETNAINIQIERLKEWMRLRGIVYGIDPSVLENRNAESDLTNVTTQLEGVEDSQNKVNKAVNAYDNLGKSIKKTINFVKNLADTVNPLFDNIMDNLDYLGGETNTLTAGWKEFGDAMVSSITDISSALEQIQIVQDEIAKGGFVKSLMSGNLIAAAVAVLGVIIKVVSAIGKLHDARLDREIEKQQERIDALKDAYARLEKQIEKTWSSVSYMQTYEQQVANIREQIDAMEAQMRAEEAKKNTDDNAVRQYQRDIQDAYDQLEELEQKSIEVFGGIGEEGYRSAAEGFVDAWKSAFLETGDGLQGLQDHFDEFLQDWFVKQATMRIAGGMLEPVFRQIDAAVDKYGEGGTSAMLSEIERVRDMAAAIFPDLSLALEDLAGMFGVGGEGSLSGLAAGIQGMTEEQANILEAYWNSVRMYTASIDVNVARIASVITSGGVGENFVGGRPSEIEVGVSMGDMKTSINRLATTLLDNNESTNPMLQQMSLIAANTQATHQLLQSVTRSGHSLGGYGIKVFND